MTYESDPVFRKLGQELLDTRRERDELRHFVEHTARELKEVAAQFAMLWRAVPKEVRDVGLVLDAHLLLIETKLDLGTCGCKEGPPVPSSVPPTPEQIERQVLEPLPQNVRRLPVGGFRLQVKPPPPRGPGGAA